MPENVAEVKYFTATSVVSFLEHIFNICKTDTGNNKYTNLWFRGISDKDLELVPKIDRSPFIERARLEFTKAADDEERKLNLERKLLNEFTAAGALLIQRTNKADIYVTARHHGLPSRLLDWTTNPLMGLYFAVCDAKHPADRPLDGEVCCLDPLSLDIGESKATRVFLLNDPMVEKIIWSSFGYKVKDVITDVLPVAPRAISSRVMDQCSKFTLHPRNSKKMDKSICKCRIIVPCDSKYSILNELRIININRFTAYGTLDELAKEIQHEI